jgi:sugar lactone lactonase YvrE
MVSPKGKSQLFINLPEGSIGNGIRINQQGHLLVADYKKHQVLAINPITQTIDIYAQNQQMNQPNDLAIMKNGILFASDPNWKASTGNIWRVNKDKTISLLEENMGTTNGIEVSPDEQILYVNQSVQRNIWAYDLSPSGAISNKRLFHQFPDFGMDGMRCDSKGNLYVTRYNKGTIAILSPEGKLLKEVQLKGKKPSNITFGGKDGKTCYITLQDRGCLERFESEFAGREWSW